MKMHKVAVVTAVLTGFAWCAMADLAPIGPRDVTGGATIPSFWESYAAARQNVVDALAADFDDFASDVDVLAAGGTVILYSPPEEEATGSVQTSQVSVSGLIALLDEMPSAGDFNDPGVSSATLRADLSAAIMQLRCLQYALISAGFGTDYGLIHDAGVLFDRMDDLANWLWNDMDRVVGYSVADVITAATADYFDDVVADGLAGVATQLTQIAGRLGGIRADIGSVSRSTLASRITTERNRIENLADEVSDLSAEIQDIVGFLEIGMFEQ